MTVFTQFFVVLFSCGEEMDMWIDPLKDLFATFDKKLAVRGLVKLSVPERDMDIGIFMLCLTQQNGADYSPTSFKTHAMSFQRGFNMLLMEDDNRRRRKFVLDNRARREAGRREKKRLPENHPRLAVLSDGSEYPFCRFVYSQKMQLYVFVCVCICVS